MKISSLLVIINRLWAKPFSSLAALLFLFCMLLYYSNKRDKDGACLAIKGSFKSESMSWPLMVNLLSESWA